MRLFANKSILYLNYLGPIYFHFSLKVVRILGGAGTTEG
jgi:hypothetical protein